MGCRWCAKFHDASARSGQAAEEEGPGVGVRWRGWSFFHESAATRAWDFLLGSGEAAWAEAARARLSLQLPAAGLLLPLSVGLIFPRLQPWRAPSVADAIMFPVARTRVERVLSLLAPD